MGIYLAHVAWYYAICHKQNSIMFWAVHDDDDDDDDVDNVDDDHYKFLAFNWNRNTILHLCRIQ